MTGIGGVDRATRVRQRRRRTEREMLLEKRRHLEEASRAGPILCREEPGCWPPRPPSRMGDAERGKV